MIGTAHALLHLSVQQERHGSNKKHKSNFSRPCLKICEISHYSRLASHRWAISRGQEMTISLSSSMVAIIFCQEKTPGRRGSYLPFTRCWSITSDFHWLKGPSTGTSSASWIQSFPSFQPQQAPTAFEGISIYKAGHLSLLPHGSPCIQAPNIGCRVSWPAGTSTETLGRGVGWMGQEEWEMETQQYPDQISFNQAKSTCL